MSDYNDWKRMDRIAAALERISLAIVVLAVAVLGLALCLIFFWGGA